MASLDPVATSRDPAALGTTADLRRRAQALALLDLVLLETPEHQFGQAEGLFDGVELAGRGNGSGDDVLLVFTRDGALIRGFDHESKMSPYDPDVATMHLSDDELEELSLGDEAALLEELRPYTGVLDALPSALEGLLEQLDREPTRPVPVPSVMTFLLWRAHDDPAWQVGQIEFPDADDPDGSGYLLSHYSCDAAAYRKWLEDYSGLPVPLQLVEAVFAHQPLTAELLGGLEPARSLDELTAAAAGIGYGT